MLSADGESAPAGRGSRSRGLLVSDLCLRSAIELAGMLRRREVSAREVVSAHIARIEAR